MELVVFLLALVTSALITRWVRDFAVRHQWVSSPEAKRDVQGRPLPRLGGVAIFLTLWAMALVTRLIPGHLGLDVWHWFHLTAGILGPATIVFLLGLTDDFRHLGAYWKFGVQIVAAILLYVNGFRIEAVSSMFGGGSVGWIIGLPLTILWVLLITNAFNLIDGLDGLAAGSALFSTLVICVIALASHHKTILFLTLALAGAIAGFLRYNFNPASIFLGDCGSLLIGFMLSAIALAGSEKSPTMVAVAIPLIALGLPILDVSIAVIRRFLSRQPLFHADCEHIHHRLLSRGVSHRQTVLLLYGVSAGFALLSLLLLNPGGRTLGIVLVVLGLGVLVGVQQLRFHEFVELKQFASRTLNLRQVIANDVGVRRIVGALRSCESSRELCLVLQAGLKPIGFDGFGFYLLTDVPEEIECFPLQRENGHKFRFAWNNVVALSDVGWSFTFGLQIDGHRVGGFSLYRKNIQPRLWMDLNVLTTTSSFSLELAQVIERIQHEWQALPHAKSIMPSRQAN